MRKPEPIDKAEVAALTDEELIAELRKPGPDEVMLAPGVIVKCGGRDDQVYQARIRRYQLSVVRGKTEVEAADYAGLNPPSLASTIEEVMISRAESGDSTIIDPDNMIRFHTRSPLVKKVQTNQLAREGVRMISEHPKIGRHMIGAVKTLSEVNLTHGSVQDNNRLYLTIQACSPEERAELMESEKKWSQAVKDRMAAETAGIKPIGG
jgi:hypothetical protein